VSGSQSQQASVSHASINRTPLTRAHVDDMLKRMVGSFSVAAEQTPSHSVVSSGVPSRPPSQPSRPPSQPSRPPSQPSRPPSQPSRPTSHSSRPASHLTSRGESYTSERSITITGPGLLSASRPSPPQAGLSPRSKDSPLPGSSLRHGSFPRSGALPFAAPAHLTANPAGAGAIGAARSLPAATREEARDALTPLSTPLSPPSGLSPQTTGSTDTSRRRGPVLVRGGFGTASAKATSPSPSHSPVRAYRSALHADELAGHGHQGTVSSSGNPIRRSATLTSMGSGAPRIGRTAPSSFSADADTELDAATGAAGTTGGMGGSALGGALASALGRSRSRAREPASTSTSPTASTSASEASPVVEGLMARLALADRRRDERERRRDDFYPGP
jgi:autophagy-related protein 13